MHVVQRVVRAGMRRWTLTVLEELGKVFAPRQLKAGLSRQRR